MVGRLLYIQLYTGDCGDSSLYLSFTFSSCDKHYDLQDIWISLQPGASTNLCTYPALPLCKGVLSMGKGKAGGFHCFETEIEFLHTLYE